MLAEHGRSQLGPWRLGEGVVLGQSQEGSNLHRRDLGNHRPTVDGEFSRCRHLGPKRTLTPMSENTHTKSDPKIEAVERLYAAYGRGDVDAVLAELADDVDWAAEASGTSVPWWGPYRGKSEVPRFFKEIGSNVDVTSFDLVSMTSNDTDVVATVHWTFTVNATGKTAA